MCTGGRADPSDAEWERQQPFPPGSFYRVRVDAARPDMACADQARCPPVRGQYRSPIPVSAAVLSGARCRGRRMIGSSVNPLRRQGEMPFPGGRTGGAGPVSPGQHLIVIGAGGCGWRWFRANRDGCAWGDGDRECPHPALGGETDLLTQVPHPLGADLRPGATAEGPPDSRPGPEAGRAVQGGRSPARSATEGALDRSARPAHSTSGRPRLQLPTATDWGTKSRSGARFW